MRNMLHKIYNAVQCYVEKNKIHPDEIYIPKIWYEKFIQDYGPYLQITLLPDNKDWFGDPAAIPDRDDLVRVHMHIYANGMDDSILLRKK